MAAITQLAPSALPGRPYGDFTGKGPTINPAQQYAEALWSAVTMRQASVTEIVMRQASTGPITMQGG